MFQTDITLGLQSENTDKRSTVAFFVIFPDFSQNAALSVQTTLATVSWNLKYKHRNMPQLLSLSVSKFLFFIRVIFIFSMNEWLAIFANSL